MRGRPAPPAHADAELSCAGQHGCVRSLATDSPIQLERNMGESVFLSEADHLAANVCVREPRRVPAQTEDREAVARLDGAHHAQRRKIGFEQGDAHDVVTAASTLSDPERKPRRSSATRAKPAAPTA